MLEDPTTVNNDESILESAHTPLQCQVQPGRLYSNNLIAVDRFDSSIFFKNKYSRYEYAVGTYFETPREL